MRDGGDSGRLFLSWASLVAVAVILWIVIPVGIGILLGAFLAFMAEPIFERLARRIGARSAASMTVVGACVGLAVVIGGLGTLFVTRGTALATQLGDAFEATGQGTRALATLAHLTSRVGISRSDLAQHAQSAVAHVAAQTTSIAAAIASATGGAVLALLFAMMAMFYVLRNWPALLRGAQETLPIRPEHTRALFEEFRLVGRTTLAGAIGTGFAQGLFATIGFWLAGVPEAIFFGALTLIASFVPVVGTLAVTVPIGITLLLVGHVFGGVLELAWALVFVVGLCDYVIRPRLVRGEDKVPALVTFAALFGGVETFGLRGLIIGPVLMSLALAVLRIYGVEARNAREQAAAPDASDPPDPPDDRT